MTGIILLTLALAAPRYSLVNKPLSPGAMMGIQSFVQTDACPDVNSRLSLTGGNVCVASKHSKRICFDWVRTSDPTVVGFTATVAIPGTRTVGSVSLPETKTEIIRKPLSPAAIIILNGFVGNQICLAIDTRFGFPLGTCLAADHAKRMCVTWDRSVTPVVVSVTASVRLPDGTWKPGAP